MACVPTETPVIDLEPTEPVVTIIKRRKSEELQPLTRTQLIQAVAWIMEDIIEGKGKAFSLPSEIPKVTAFHASNLPVISIQDYLARFCHYAKCEEEALIYALIYIDRIGELMREFSLDSFNVHKILLMSMAAACKFCDDSYFTNTYYANVGGIPVEDFNILEQEFLVNYLQFDLYVKVDTYNTYCTDIAKYYKSKISAKGK